MVTKGLSHSVLRFTAGNSFGVRACMKSLTQQGQSCHCSFQGVHWMSLFSLYIAVDTNMSELMGFNTHLAFAYHLL